MDSVPSEDWLTPCGNPHTSKSIGVNLITINQTSTTVVLGEREGGREGGTEGGKEGVRKGGREGRS